MIDSIFSYICLHADQAHYIFFGLLFLAGLNVPISEDLLLLTGGAIVSRCMPEHYLNLYLWMFFGCWISGWEAYFIGRFFGPKLYQISWFRKIINPEKIKKINSSLDKFGVWTFIAGRFIPGGVRNALFITCGLGKMDFWQFIKRDFLATVISTNILFYLGYSFGENYELISAYFTQYNNIAIILLIILLSALSLKATLKSRSTI